MWYRVEFLSPDERHHILLVLPCGSITELYNLIQEAWPNIPVTITSLGKEGGPFRVVGRMTPVC